MTDVVEAIHRVRAILRRDWEKANTSNRTPVIEEIDEVKNPQVSNNNDWVLLYEAANEDDYPALNLEFKDQYWIISMEMRTASKIQVRRMDQEIVRILDASNKEVGGNYAWLTLQGRKVLVQDKNKPFYDTVRDVKVNKLSVIL